MLKDFLSDLATTVIPCPPELAEREGEDPHRRGITDRNRRINNG